MKYKLIQSPYLKKEGAFIPVSIIATNKANTLQP